MKKMLKKVNLKLLNSRKKSFLFLLILFLVLVVGGTMAFFTTSSSLENRFRTSYYDVSIAEEFYNDWGTKKVSIINEDSANVVIRISYNEIWTESKESDIKSYLSNKIFDIASNTKVDIVIKEWTTDWNDNFIDGKDGWYYYKKVLPANSSVQVLNKITLDKEVLSANNKYDLYINANYELDFKYEAVQADLKAIKELWGHDVTINNDEISWNFN